MGMASGTEDLVLAGYADLTVALLAVLAGVFGIFIGMLIYRVATRKVAGAAK